MSYPSLSPLYAHRLRLFSLWKWEVSSLSAAEDVIRGIRAHLITFVEGVELNVSHASAASTFVREVEVYRPPQLHHRSSGRSDDSKGSSSSLTRSTMLYRVLLSESVNAFYVTSIPSRPAQPVDSKSSSATSSSSSAAAASSQVVEGGTQLLEVLTMKQPLERRTTYTAAGSTFAVGDFLVRIGTLSVGGISRPVIVVEIEAIACADVVVNSDMFAKAFAMLIPEHVRVYGGPQQQQQDADIIAMLLGDEGKSTLLSSSSTVPSSSSSSTSSSSSSSSASKLSIPTAIDARSVMETYDLPREVEPRHIAAQYVTLIRSLQT